MKLEKLNKIRAMALDVRGDAATRAIAQRILRKYSPTPAPKPKAPPKLVPRSSYEEEFWSYLDRSKAWVKPPVPRSQTYLFMQELVKWAIK